jgi:hypothetical protein
MALEHLWPHKLTLRTAVLVAVLVCVIRYALLLGAAWLDCSLVLRNGDVGFLQHPGAISIPVGDALLFVLSTIAAGGSSRIGLKLPSTRPALVQRFFRQRLWWDVYRGQRRFLSLFSAASFVGFAALINQTTKLFHYHYYGHDTFDSIHFPYSFLVQRLNLAISWCFVLPAFVAYAMIHIHCLRTVVKLTRLKGLSAFYTQHPDKSGGYAFFGVLNLLYVAGATVILLEVSLTYYTHRKIDYGNVSALTLGSGMILFISIFAMREIRKTIKMLEAKLKARNFRDAWRTGRGANSYDLLLHYNVRFNAYSLTSAWSLAIVRVVAAAPALLNIAKVIHFVCRKSTDWQTPTRPRWPAEPTRVPILCAWRRRRGSRTAQCTQVRLRSGQCQRG